MEGEEVKREIENKGERGGSNSAISDVTGKTGKQKLSLLISLIPVCGMQLLYRLQTIKDWE